MRHIKPIKKWDIFLNQRYKTYLAIGAEQRKISPVEYEKRLNIIIQKYISSASLYHRTTVKKLLKILKDNRFKNQFEFCSSDGLNNKEVRKTIEKEMFGIPKGQKASRRPIYGYLSNKNGTEAASYGEVIILFKNNVKNRATCTFGDSLDICSFNNTKKPTKGLLCLTCRPKKLSEADSKIIPISQLKWKRI